MIAVEDLPGGDGAALVERFGGPEGAVTVMVRLDGTRLAEIRYAGREGPQCGELPPPGEVEARGNEPFWILRVDGETARWRTPETPDGVAYGDGRWQGIGDGRWRYDARREAAGETSVIVLELTETRCTDGMSGAWFPFRAVVTRDGRRVEGCALEGRAALSS